ncbi:DUF3168 domain-containing protein [Streptomyces parvus]|uniref:DUF3168 domain-containing protein n=1 Tax=Streptomyces parvus TaxID=66428 RepID=UPI003323F994
MTTAPHPMLAIQKAIRDVLYADSTLTAMVSAVYDYLPPTATYPYVVLGEAMDTPANAHDRFGRNTVITLHVWSQYRGYAQALDITGRLVELLDHQPLDIVGLDHVVTRYEFSQTLTDPEPPGDIRHAVVRFRVVTEKPPG